PSSAPRSRNGRAWRRKPTSRPSSSYCRVDSRGMRPPLPHGGSVRWVSLDIDSRGAIAVRLTQIRDFLAVFECGGIRAAARKLGVSQPTITKSVRALETELHVQLFARNARGLAPTASGRAFFARARVAHSELRKAEEEAAEAGGSATGSVDFGVGPLSVA